jgi:hypothetical protein
MASAAIQKPALVADRARGSIDGFGRSPHPSLQTRNASLATSVAMRSRQRSISYGATVAVACFIGAIVILSFIIASVGIGYEGNTGVGPDRPPPPSAAAPEPRPEPGLP